MSLETSSSSGGKARFVIVALVIAVVLWATQGKWMPYFADANTPAPAETASAAATPSAGVPVMVEAAGEDRDEVVIEAIGTARARRSVTLFPETDGVITAFEVESGAQVASGDVILRLDSRDTSLAVRVAETRVKEAESALDRAQRLRDNNVRSRANVDDAEVILERAKLELNQAQEALADRTLRAPFAGVIGIPKVETGDRVTTETEIITLDDRSTLLAEFEVAERYLARLGLDMPVEARTPTFPDRRIEGRIEKIDSRVDPVSRTVLVRAAFENTDDALRPGMSFFITLTLPGPMLTSVPELALQWRDGVSFVWRVREGKAERVEVASKRRLNTKVLIEGDVEPGDLVVVEGVQRLRNGREVAIQAVEDRS